MPSSAALLAGLVLLFWIVLASRRDRRFPRDHFLERASPAGAAVPQDDAAVAAIVPARDEADVLGRSLPSLLAQDHLDFRVVLVDDGSSDGTGELARRLGNVGPDAADAGEDAADVGADAADVGADAPDAAADAADRGGRLQVVAAGDKPDGWAGKVFAQSRGLEEILAAGEAPEWLLLTDADIRHPPDSVRSLVAKARRGGWDLVSVMARLHAETVFERLLIPPFVFFFHLLYPFREIGRRGTPTAAAAGGCVLIRTSVLLEAGGFEAMRGALIDDVSLGRLVKKARGQLWLGFDPEVESIRPYRGLGELWRMVARSAFVQLRFSYLAVAGVVAGLAIFFCAPPLMLVLALSGLVGGGGPERLVTAAAALGAWSLQAALLLPFVRHHRCPPPWAWLLPVASALYAGMTVSSAWSHLLRRGSRWKGRGYAP